jgi:hypothetical protein
MEPTMITRPLRSIAAAALLSAMLVACSHGGGTQYHDTNMDFGSIHTVAVLPFANLSRDTAGAARVREVFSNLLLATGSIYVLPQGDVSRGIMRSGIQDATAPSAEEITKLGSFLKCDAIIGGVVKEYGEVRSGSAAGNVVSVSVQMYEVATGKVIWSASSTKGGIGMKDRMFGGGGEPANYVTESAADDLLDKLFK